MRQVKVEALTHESFAPFGQFYTMDKPQGYALRGELHQFFPNRLTAMIILPECTCGSNCTMIDLSAWQQFETLPL